MDALSLLQPRPRSWLVQSVLGSSAGAYGRYLAKHGYAQASARAYFSGVAHFAHWLSKRGIPLERIDELQVQHFVFDHLPRCRCPRPVRCNRHEVRAALHHLLVVLRSQRRIPAAVDADLVSVRNELHAFARHLDEVCGLAPATRLQRIKIIRGFLVDRFGSAPIRPSQLAPGDIHRFVRDTFGGCKPSTANVLCGILRSYFRFRSMRGDETSGLIAAVPRAACWRLAGLPQAPSDQQIEAFLGAFDRTSASGRRNYAMARCLVDLGLRAGEVAQLQLDDIDWRHGTLRIAANKSRRIDLLPLPARTGQAIVQYLRAGRPATASRALFVRHVAPLDAPIGLDIVRAAMRGAYVRCGWAYSDGTHVLRHSTASRLLRAGTPLKQIADILRHRSVDTTVIYTKVDLEKLAMIAMPWPGSRS